MCDTAPLTFSRCGASGKLSGIVLGVGGLSFGECSSAFNLCSISFNLVSNSVVVQSVVESVVELKPSKRISLFDLELPILLSI